MMNDALLPLLPSLVALIEERSVTRAAARLKISQPRMSARLADLRHLTGDPLLIAATSQRGLIPTRRAIALADAARRGLHDLGNAFANTLFDPVTATRTFAIMANDNAAAIIGTRLIGAIRSQAGPNVRVAIHAHDKDRLGDLEQGRLDVALGAPAQFSGSPALITRALASDHFVTASGTASSGPIDLDEFCRRDHVMVSGDGGGFDGIVDTALARLGRRRRVVASVQSYLLAIEIAASENLLATLPSGLLVRRTPGLVLSPTPLELGPFRLSAAWHPRSAGDPAQRWLLDTLFALSHAGEGKGPASPSIDED